MMDRSLRPLEVHNTASCSDLDLQAVTNLPQVGIPRPENKHGLFLRSHLDS